MVLQPGDPPGTSHAAAVAVEDDMGFFTALLVDQPEIGQQCGTGCFPVVLVALGNRMNAGRELRDVEDLGKARIPLWFCQGHDLLHRLKTSPATCRMPGL